MFKMYLNNFYGQSPAAWDNNWHGSNIDDAIIFASYNNPYKVDFDRYCKPGKKIIEAGCGLGAFVVSYAKKGCDIVGVDFAQDTISYLKSRFKGFPVEYASLEKIPYPNDYFDVYLSLGVIEHFEEGPFKALREAHRVIKPNGHIILTVPWINICKQLKYKMDLKKYKDNYNRKLCNTLLRFDENCYYEKIDKFRKGVRTDFYQYEFTRKEIVGILKELKFEIINTHGISVVYGFKYIPILGPFIFSNLKKSIEKKKLKENSMGQVSNEKETDTVSFDLINVPPLKKGNFVMEVIKDIIIRENIKNIFNYPIVRLLQELCGDFLLVVGRPIKPLN